jgi:hypothetical protein
VCVCVCVCVCARLFAPSPFVNCLHFGCPTLSRVVDVDADLVGIGSARARDRDAGVRLWRRSCRNRAHVAVVKPRTLIRQSPKVRSAGPASQLGPVGEVPGG